MDYHPDVVQAIVRGAPDTELKAIRARVTEEYAERSAARQRGPAVMWQTRDGRELRDGQPVGIDASPQQRSITHTSVPHTGTE